MGDITFEDADLSDHDEPKQVRGESYDCWELRQIIRDDSLPLEDRDGAAEELERLRNEVMPTHNFCWGSSTGTVLC